MPLTDVRTAVAEHERRRLRMPRTPARPSLARRTTLQLLVSIGLLGGLAFAQVDAPAWQTLPLVDVRTGSTFTIADLRGRTVFLEPMATWCSSCRRQMTVLREVAAELDPAAFVFVGLSVETNLSPAELAAYADAQGFDWTFAVMSPELLGALVDAFGRSVANPPATPHVIVRSDGSVTDLATGHHSAPQLLAALSAAADR
jgi:thiol-disulfide isomerase/thioredoxin